ncbi:hypothetical protein BX600DRAFT_509705 [Xylariales sp. PMI_506]|nr:hypothetical protein BX600DRAFT_509705 [Xylariales sp. PMI_506]
MLKGSESGYSKSSTGSLNPNFATTNVWDLERAGFTHPRPDGVLQADIRRRRRSLSVSAPPPHALMSHSDILRIPKLSIDFTTQRKADRLHAGRQKVDLAHRTILINARQKHMDEGVRRLPSDTATQGQAAQNQFRYDVETNSHIGKHHPYSAQLLSGLT